ncbi:MAG TPA: hypothetical protein PLU23_08315, partial [Anaerolineaceae bacterium]|nr:hypothetical protein [Anaerolineaceae bacterium]
MKPRENVNLLSLLSENYYINLLFKKQIKSLLSIFWVYVLNAKELDDANSFVIIPLFMTIKRLLFTLFPAFYDL